MTAMMLGKIGSETCAPLAAAAEGISFAFGRMSSTDECGSGENTGRRSEFEMLHQKWPHWHAWKSVAGMGEEAYFPHLCLSARPG